MPNNSTPTNTDIANALYEALGNAVDNLHDATADIALAMECCADIAALQRLLAPDACGEPNILAYL